MLERFKSFVAGNNLCRPSEKVLVTVSGGVDSVAMLDLFHRSGFDIGIAHCNFRLRGTESDGDENFVRDLAAEKGLQLNVQDFDTESHAMEQGISVQMAARKLRYDWFESLRKQHLYDWIATAHNQDDVLETFFINLSRGTGIRGLSGIPLRSGRVIRPILFASREEILEYAGMNRLAYREDSSNAQDKYLRNRIRHKLIPMMEEQNPSFRQSMTQTIERLADAGIIFLRELERMKKDIISTGEGKVMISLAGLKKTLPLKTLLYEILSEYNFSSQQTNDVIHSLAASPGKRFFSASHRLVKDRDQLIITPVEERESRKYYLELSQGSIMEPVTLEWVVVDRPGFNIPPDPDVACLDLDLLDFPLILRHWQAGDYFRPLGMKGMKKLSDFLIDLKIPIPDKERVWILASGTKIVWVAGFRIDDRFRVSDKTSQILVMRYRRPAASSGIP